jgi:nucleotide-binding universal stress UspA family protein
MRILLAADGSTFTKKALAFLVTHEAFTAGGGEVLVLNVQAPLPPRVKTMVGQAACSEWHREEALRVLEPAQQFLSQHKLAFKTRWVVGHAADEIVAAAGEIHAEMIVMGTHGHGLLGRALMGSVAQKVVTLAEIPVLLVK